MHILHKLRRQSAAAPHLRLLAPLVAVLAAAMLLTPSLASADSASTLTVIGTSDVSDSGLMTNIIQPAFAAAYPQYTFKYIGTATGTAIANAESGAVGASALIVHAASLENQFVANGYSYERYGRALFTNDFVLGGPNGDPAGVAANAKNNIAQAFADVATAGVAGKATFVSRGGTPGTTVEEHEIWNLVNQSGLTPSGVLLCAVNATNGGGLTPIAAGNGVTASGQACPNNGALPTAAALPTWYKATGLTQGPNVVAANACTGTTTSSGANSCYVLTDRGTYDYLASGTDPAGAVPNLSIVSRDNAASAPGGQYALINYFHGYIINPAKPGQSVNLPAAQAFLNLLTSPTLQTEIGNYLSNTADPGGAPFRPDASPVITATLPKTYVGGKKTTVTGTVANAQPGYPAPNGAVVTVNRVVGNIAVPLATGYTKAGAYSISFTPPATGSYQVTTGQITQLENTTLSPAFGDILSPASSAAGAVSVTANVVSFRARAFGKQVLVLGSVAPGFDHVKGTVTVTGRPLHSKRGYRTLGKIRVDSGDGNFAGTFKLGKGRWQLRAVFSDPGTLTASAARTSVVNVTGKPGAGVSIKSLKVSGDKLTATVKLAKAGKGASVKLLGLTTTNGNKATFRQLARTSVSKGRTTATLHVTLKAGDYKLQFEYQVKGSGTGYTGLRSETVKATT